jgi:hypothetical protein
MLLNLFETFASEIKKEETMTQINNILKPYVISIKNDLIDSFMIYFYILTLLLVLIFFSNIYMLIKSIELRS